MLAGEVRARGGTFPASMHRTKVRGALGAEPTWFNTSRSRRVLLVLNHGGDGWSVVGLCMGADVGLYQECSGSGVAPSAVQALRQPQCSAAVTRPARASCPRPKGGQYAELLEGDRQLRVFGKHGFVADFVEPSVKHLFIGEGGVDIVATGVDSFLSKSMDQSDESGSI